MPGVLILGAAGFLGTHVVEQLWSETSAGPLTCVSREEHVTYDRDHEAVSWLQADVVAASAADLRELLVEVRPSTVVNCVGLIRGTREELFDVNARFVRSLVGALVAQGGIALVQLGSAAEYGRQPAGSPIDEDAEPFPVADYGHSKLWGSTAAARAIDSGLLVGRVLRVFNPIGRGSPETSAAGAIARALREALEQGATTVEVGPLGDFRDFVDARDVARAVVRSTLGHTGGPSVLNVGRGEAVQVRTIATRLAVVAGYSGGFCETPSEAATPVPWQQADIARTRAALGWSPRRTPNDALTALWSSMEAPVPIG